MTNYGIDARMVFDQSGQDISTSLAQSATQLTDMVYSVKTYGLAKGDGVTDDTTAIKNTIAQAISSGGTVFFPKGDYVISDVLVISSNIKVELSQKARIFQTNTAKNIFQLKSAKVIITGGEVILPASTTGSCIYINGYDMVQNCTVKNINLRMTDYTGKGIYVDATDSSGTISNCYSLFNTFKNIMIFKGDTGIKIADNLTASWNNSYIFDTIYFWNPNHTINLTKLSGGHIFNNIQMQWGSNVVDFVTVDSQDNVFKNITYYDIPNGTQVYNLTANSQNNRIELWYTNSANTIRTLVNDMGVSNTIDDPSKSPKIPSANMVKNIKSDGTYTHYYPEFFGNQDDLLYYATNRFTVTADSGTVASLAYAFRVNDVGALITNPTTGSPAQITVNFGTTKYITGIGLCFYSYYPATSFEVWGYTGGTWTMLESVANNARGNYLYLANAPISCTQIRVVIKGSSNINNNNPSNYVYLQRFYAFGDREIGATFLNIGGGSMYGDITLKSGGISRPITTITSNNTLTTSMSTVLGNATSAAFTMTLPDATTMSGREFVLKKIDSSANTITIACTSTQTIDGATTQVLSSQWSKIKVQSDGTNWQTV